MSTRLTTRSNTVPGFEKELRLMAEESPCVRRKKDIQREEIDRKVAEFSAAGGQVTSIDMGVSGDQVYLAKGKDKQQAYRDKSWNMMEATREKRDAKT